MTDVPDLPERETCHVWVVDQSLPDAPRQFLLQNARPNDLVLSCDGTSHAWGVDAPSVYEASNIETGPVAPGVVATIRVGTTAAFVVLPLAECADFIVDRRVLTNDQTAAGQTALLWGPRGETSAWLEANRELILTIAREEAGS